MVVSLVQVKISYWFLDGDGGWILDSGFWIGVGQDKG